VDLRQNVGTHILVENAFNCGVVPYHVGARVGAVDVAYLCATTGAGGLSPQFRLIFGLMDIWRLRAAKSSRPCFGASRRASSADPWVALAITNKRRALVHRIGWHLRLIIGMHARQRPNRRQKSQRQTHPRARRSFW
jgi:hypothetical protein